MSERVALIVTDRPDRSAALTAALDTIVPCKVISNFHRWNQPESLLGIVADVDLVRKEAVHTVTAIAKSAKVPVLVLTRRRGEQSFAQAMAIGASVCLPDHIVPGIFLDTFIAYTYPGTRMSDLVLGRAVSRATTALTDLMKRARIGDAVDPDGIEACIDPILTAVSDQSLSRWLDFVWTVDDATYQHCLLVAGLAAAISVHLQFSELDRQYLVRAALLHDVGKAKIPLKILNKPGPLDADELVVMRTHATIGYDLLKAAGGFDAATCDIVRHHHEMLDGSGYPDRLAGAAISDSVRLITICDIYAALIEQRPYRKGMATADALQILWKMAGKLDFDLLDVFKKAITSM